MFLTTVFFSLLLHCINAKFQVNLHYTDHRFKNNRTLFYDCLHASIPTNEDNPSRQIVSYCFNDFSPDFQLNVNSDVPKFKFGELFKQNITGEQLYHWSAPIDVAEQYQLYLNQMVESNNNSLETEVFYNCTYPRFGSTCQYEFISHPAYDSSLNDILRFYFQRYSYEGANLTCYNHLKCNRGPSPACLDWRDICNGQLDCLNNDIDEKDCWQLEINECNYDQYQCHNGQCIPKIFRQDRSNAPDCIDGSDETSMVLDFAIKCLHKEPSFECEERTSSSTHIVNGWNVERIIPTIKAMLSVEDKLISEECLPAFKSILTNSEPGQLFDLTCEKSICLEIIERSCPDMFYFPNIPIFMTDIYLAYKKNDSYLFVDDDGIAPYICYNSSHYEDSSTFPDSFFFKNTTCFRAQLDVFATGHIWTSGYNTLKALDLAIDEFKSRKKLIGYPSDLCNRSNMYKCDKSSKCLSTRRLLDRYLDCPGKDDENETHIQVNGLARFLKNHFQCVAVNQYLHPSFVQDGICDCKGYNNQECEDESLRLRFTRKGILFQNLCDGYNGSLIIPVEGKNQTEETECENWPCNNVYTHCDHKWNCPKGNDETNCFSLPTFNCPSDYHMCVSPENNELMCLPVSKANDGTIDCLGATDERNLCSSYSVGYYMRGFYCSDQIDNICIREWQLCNKMEDCIHGEDEQFCRKNRTNNRICLPISNQNYLSDRSEAEQFLCNMTGLVKIVEIKDFTLVGMTTVNHGQTKSESKVISPRPSPVVNERQSKKSCHRGFPVNVWLDDKKNLKTQACLCPPNFYGDHCQYQNQRISLTIRFQAVSDSWSTLFAMFISLIDDSDQRTIHSYEQFNYLSVRDCKTKFNIYLLYATRPKDPSYNYSIHIDIYEKISLNYRASLLYPIQFSFLPVHRLAFIGNIPPINDNIYKCIDSQCKNGKCVRYSNSLNNATFCQCDQGWSGRSCNIPYECKCSSGSKCIGITADNRPICVCSNNKFGYRCLLENTICQTNKNTTCENGGQCIPTDEYMSSLNRKFICVCPRNYSGDRCQISDKKIIFSFDKGIVIPQSIFIHFFRVINDIAPMRTTTFRTVPYVQDSLTIYWSRPFHFIFVELTKKDYYLASMENSYNRSTTITKMLKKSDRCPHINELFDGNFVKMNPLRRIKQYHVPCQKNLSDVTCFHDDERICFCYELEKQRLSNCFDFDSKMKMDCLGHSVCENDAECFQDSPDCPERSICICKPCYYGVKCQFSTNGFGLSLDAIIGYQIQPNIKLTNQPKLIQVSSALTMIFIILGLINGIISLITFRRKIICEVGCGLYLLGSSITTLLTTILFGFKFWILILAQMTSITNRSFLKFQCISLDFLLRSCLCMDQWLNACVIVERAVTTIKGPRFRKSKSKKASKIVIPLLLIFVIATSIHDPIHRRLLDEENEDEKRIWCIVGYSPFVKTYNSVIYTFHFLAPFAINLVSAIILIKKKASQKLNLQVNSSFLKIFKEQLEEHKHLLIAPVVLVILGIPRLVISFLSKCMQSTNDAWLFLFGYFISLIPPMLTYVVFILPSKFYKRELRQSLLYWGATVHQQVLRIRNLF